VKRLVVGILAHVDSGKTTLSEAMLYRAGALRTLGRVDHGDAFLDNNALERERGITIFAKDAVLSLPEAELTLLDTPGHADLSAEAERTLWALDYAILVVSGTDGVQSHTDTLWNLLRRYRVPTFIFVNKMDLPGAEKPALLRELKARLSGGCADFGAEDGALFEELALCDDALAERYLEDGSLSDGDIGTAVARRRVFPCFFGSALKTQGVDELLHGLCRFTREPERHDAFAAKVFKITQDAGAGRLTHMVITGGRLAVRDAVSGVSASGREWCEKVSQLRIYSGAKYRAVDEALPGMVCAAAGLTATYDGEGLGAEDDAVSPVLEPVLRYRLLLPPEVDVHTALSCLHKLEEEIPEIRAEYSERLSEIHLQIMGQVQLEIIRSLIKERFGFDAEFGHGGILYRETIARAAEGVGHYEPLRHYAEVHLLLEPGEPGSGLVFDTACREDDLDRSWQRLILTHLAEKTHVGTLTGSPITDMKITLVSGRAHTKHTEGGDFREATYRAVRQGLREAGCVLLEPWYDLTLSLPTENLGRAMNDIQRMGGELGAPESTGEVSLLRGRAPVSSLQDYQTEVSAYTHGRGKLSYSLCGYLPCRSSGEVVSALGYDCDADTANTADSVFCLHGAGYAVRWDEVYKYMHIPAMKDRKRQTEMSPARLAASTAAYFGTLAEDEELLRIFERTYGPVRRDLYAALGPVPKTAAPGAPVPEEKEYLLVDGYNIIFSWDDLNALARESLDAARGELINILCNYKGVRGCELILVFDAYRVKDSPGSVELVHNIHVVYTKEAETADMYIEKVTHELGRHKRVRVATSDGLEQLIVLGQGAQRIPARAFRQEVDDVTAAIRAYIGAVK